MNRRGLKSGLTRRTKRMITGYLFISPFLVGFIFFILGPLITTVRMSFSSVGLDAAGSRFVLDPAGLANYMRALTLDANFNRMLTESLGGMALQVPLVTIVSLFLAVMLNRRFPGRGAAFVIRQGLQNNP